MKTEQVRCWRTGLKGELFITYPEGDMGHRLICCTACGKVYAVNVTKQLYIEPDLDAHLSGKMCIGCGAALDTNWRYYPEHYLDESGKLRAFERTQIIPPDEESVIEAFPEVFS
ncbi:MAG: hypothetical protein HC845_08455 [Akkermansiaceae bacterium]|nr:hypothetical protein [Akkermansiaceae bacterium]